MPWAQFTLSGPAGSVSFSRARIEDDSRFWDIESSRPPLSNIWFKYGSKQEKEGRLGIVVEPTARNLGNTNALLQNLEKIAPSANQLSWQGRNRALYGLAGDFQMGPGEYGYSVRFALATLPGDWSSPAVAVPSFGYAATQLSIGSVEIPGFYPDERLPIARRFELTEYGVSELGDLLYLPSTLNVVAHARATTPEAAFKLALEVTEAARTADVVDARSRYWSVFGLRSAKRRYTKYAKVEVALEFLPSGRYDPSSALFPSSTLFPSNTLLPN